MIDGPLIGDWLCLSNLAIVELTKVSAVSRNSQGVKVYLADFASSDSAFLEFVEPQRADKIWMQFRTPNPIDDNWVNLTDNIAINLRHVSAVTKLENRVTVWISSIPDGKFIIEPGVRADEIFRDFYIEGSKCIL